MQKILVLCALEHEFVNLTKFNLPVVYTGVGKVNAAYAATKAVYEIKPKLIINVGTAGAVNKNCTGILTVTKVIQRDIITEPIAPRGVTPFSSIPAVFTASYNSAHFDQLNNNIITCGTGDSFVAELDPWLIENNIDIVDMELYAIAAVAYHFAIPWYSFKYVTDNADDKAASTWKEKVNDGIKEFNQLIERICHHS